MTTATKKNPVSLTITLPGVMSDYGSCADHELTITLPWYWQGIGPANFTTIISAAFPSDAWSDGWNEMIRGVMGLPCGSPSMPADMTPDQRAAAVGKAIRLIDAHCDSDNPMASLRRFLHPGARRIQ